MVYTICTRYQLSNHDIEDVGQSVWLSLVEQLGKLREPAALPGWLATTTSRECLRVVTASRAAERAWAREALEFKVPEEQDPEAQAAADCEAKLAVEMLRALPRRQRETITLAFEGYTTTEIASLLGTDRNTVRVNLHHARAKLISRLRQNEQLLRSQKSAPPPTSRPTGRSRTRLTTPRASSPTPPRDDTVAQAEPSGGLAAARR